MHLEAPAQRNPGVGLTPLIDVVFILLVFFMLATRFTTLQETPVRISAAGAAGADEQLVRVHITGAQSLELDGRPLSLGEFDQWLDEQGPRPLVITTAAEVPLQTTVRVTDLAQAAGFEDVKLALLKN